jgi:DNA-binding transcriptional MerR regulator
MTPAELTIAEVAERSGLTRHTLRYYERDGLMLGVGRDNSGHRRYSEHDLGWIELITKLRATGMPVREVRRYAELVRAGDGNEDARLALLRVHRERVRAQIAAMAAHLEAIDMKIGYYEEALDAGQSPDRQLSSPCPEGAVARRLAAGQPRIGSR